MAGESAWWEHLLLRLCRRYEASLERAFVCFGCPFIHIRAFAIGLSRASHACHLLACDTSTCHERQRMIGGYLGGSACLGAISELITPRLAQIVRVPIRGLDCLQPHYSVTLAVVSGSPYGWDTGRSATISQRHCDGAMTRCNSLLTSCTVQVHV